MLKAMRQIMILTSVNYRKWRTSPQIWLSFCLGFTACFMLTDKTVRFAEEHDTIMQMFEPFIWTFGDAKSILLMSLCLLLLFGDMPDMNNDVCFRLIRTTRFRWITAQIIYIISATFIFTLFILVSSCILSYQYIFAANQWSETAAILGYSEIGRKIAVPSFVKVLELTYPYQCTVHVFLLMLGYSMVLSSVIFFFNLLKARLGMVAGVVYSGFGLFLNPAVISKWFNYSVLQSNLANIVFGWLSPVNHATYYMHNFGYDNLPTLNQSYIIFTLAATAFFILSFFKSKSYTFNFTGTEN